MSHRKEHFIKLFFCTVGGISLHSDDWNCIQTAGRGLHGFSHLRHWKDEEYNMRRLLLKRHRPPERRTRVRSGIHLWWGQRKTRVVLEARRCPWPSWSHTRCSHRRGPLDRSSQPGSQSPSQLPPEEERDMIKTRSDRRLTAGVSRVSFLLNFVTISTFGKNISGPFSWSRSS